MTASIDIECNWIKQQFLSSAEGGNIKWTHATRFHLKNPIIYLIKEEKVDTTMFTEMEARGALECRMDDREKHYWIFYQLLNLSIAFLALSMRHSGAFLGG